MTVAPLPAKLVRTEAGEWTAPAAAAAPPAAVAITLDLTPETGLRGPFNFAGIYDERREQEVRQGVAKARAMSGPGQAPLLGFGHHPLSTVYRRPGVQHPAPLSDLLGREGACLAQQAPLPLAQDWMADRQPSCRRVSVPERAPAPRVWDSAAPPPPLGSS